MTVDPTRLRIVARGNHRGGYAGVVTIEDGPVWDWTCPHAHTATSEARSCARRAIRRALDLAGPPAGLAHL